MHRLAAPSIHAVRPLWSIAFRKTTRAMTAPPFDSTPSTDPASGTPSYRPASSAVLVVVMLLLGRFGGLVRDLIIAPLFGAGAEVDALVAARTVPELLLALVTAGAVTSGFLPALSYLSKGGSRLPDEGVKAISVVANWLLTLTVLLTLCGWLFPGALVDLVTPGLDPERHQAAASLLRVIMPVTVLVTAAAILGAWLNFRGHFALPSARAVVTNVTIIAFTLVLGRSLGIVSVAIGWVAGAFLQVVLLVPAARRSGAQYRWSLDLRGQHTLEICRIIAPIVLAQLLLYGRVLVERQFGSWLPAGDLAYLSYAYRIGTAPMMIVTNAIITVFLPVFSARATVGDQAGLRAAMGQSIRLMVIGTLPFVVVFSVLPGPTIRVLMEHGAFGPSDTATTATLLSWYAVALVGASFTMLLSQIFYAQRKGPLALFAVTVGLVVQVGVTALLIPSFEARGVAVGTALGFVASALVLAAILARSLAASPGAWKPIREARLLGPAVGMFVLFLAVDPTLEALGFSPSPMARYGLSVGLGMLLYATILWRLEIPEVAQLQQRLRGLVARRPRI